MLLCDNIVTFEAVPVLANGTNNLIIKLREIFLKHRDEPQFNQTKHLS